MLLEKKLLNKTFSYAMGKERSSFIRLDIYRDLVFTQFDSVLSGTFPMFRKTFKDDKDWSSLVSQFILKGISKTPYIWEMPKYFKDFVISTNLHKFPYAKDLLWFEWQKIEFFILKVEPYLKSGSIHFKWNLPYKISDTSIVKLLHYDFFSDDEFKEDTYYMLMYLNVEDYSIYQIKITEFLFNFFQGLESNVSADELLNKLCREFNFDFNQTKEILSPTVESFLVQRILLLA